MWCHIFRQIPGACSPFWTTHPLIFQGLLFSAMVYQTMSLMLWIKRELWRPIHFESRGGTHSSWRWTTIQFCFFLFDWKLQFFTDTKGIILIMVIWIAYIFPKRIFFSSTASHSGRVRCVNLTYMTNSWSVGISFRLCLSMISVSYQPTRRCICMVTTELFYSIFPLT